MCRYAVKEYKSHFACFACRKAFKKVAMIDYARQHGLEKAYPRVTVSRPRLKREERDAAYLALQERYLKDVSGCPECGSPMAPMGLDFKAPKQTDQEAWAIIEALYDKGYAFKGCGCYVGYQPPEHLRDLNLFFEKRGRRPSEGQKLLERISSKLHGSK